MFNLTLPLKKSPTLRPSCWHRPAYHTQNWCPQFSHNLPSQHRHFLQILKGRLKPNWFLPNVKVDLNNSMSGSKDSKERKVNDQVAYCAKCDQGKITKQITCTVRSTLRSTFVGQFSFKYRSCPFVLEYKDLWRVLPKITFNNWRVTSNFRFSITFRPLQPCKSTWGYVLTSAYLSGSFITLLIGNEFVCPETDCTKTYKTEHLLRRHLKPWSEFIFSLFFVFRAMVVLTRWKIHRDSRNGNLKCSHCEKQFCRADYLEIHIKRHLGQKDEKCENCGKGRLVTLTHQNSIIQDSFANQTSSDTS